MCGIIGLSIGANSTLSDKVAEQIFNELLLLSESRGKESSGVAIKNCEKGNIGVYKAPIPASKLLKKDGFRKFYGEYAKRSKQQSSVSLIAHARLVTNGTQENNNNNQPVIKEGLVAVHNGIIVNVDDLWSQNPDLKREYELDTEVFLSLLNKYSEEYNYAEGLKKTLKDIYGCVSMGILFQNYNKQFIFTNHGSLYTLRAMSKEDELFLFASEKYILLKLAENLSLNKLIGEYEIVQVAPKSLVELDIETLRTNIISLNSDEHEKLTFGQSYSGKIKDYTEDIPIDFSKIEFQHPNLRLKSLLEYDLGRLDGLKRCTKCVLPHTFPFIQFNDKGVCNYCHKYENIKLQDISKLQDAFIQENTHLGQPDCLVPLSGGRDSCYSLHYLVEELGKKPIAYTYDWGMVTDLARRNASRLCSKLEVEHIIVSADIYRKRQNIKKNVEAWLRKPHLGAIPLFMAGDKQYFKYAYELSKKNDIGLIIMGENYYEKTSFKSGFSGVNQDGSGLAYSIGMKSKLQMLWFYFSQFATNSSYLNRSLSDTFSAYISYYFTPHSYWNLFDFVEWEENKVEKVLFDNYDWEISPDTCTTWRIGDGTAAFYNYIYLTVAGFSEIDTFRSNQIREGVLTREEAMKKVLEDNQPRYESIKWYLDVIGIDFAEAIKKINGIKKRA